MFALHFKFVSVCLQASELTLQKSLPNFHLSLHYSPSMNWQNQGRSLGLFNHILAALSYLWNVIGQWVVVWIKSLLQMEMCMCSLCLWNSLFQKDFHPSWIATWHFNIFRCSGQNGILNIISFSPILSLCSLFLHNLVPYKMVTEEWEAYADGTVI